MNVSFNSVGQNSFLNVYRVNQSIARQNNNDDTLQLVKNLSKDSVTISPQGKAKIS
ncbi:hypothetical protein KQI41_03280 [Tissierella pigra]|uniref:hypothetical protein n=1 Tax=Tissierella pigra TaxID=2607614 RepID=UPI0012B244F2|nr:hypothetical protein [Tissierella pigra]MBU5425426.1 hypothetical protein [Tissierella pigra]